ncbi:YhjD/YihY/BrkB family envelope integrity protein [Methylococcus sp. EFPC2]|uniref:YhjD/YihY/BrkB family envelope integrity protein n=1 Tax=Methylococcus sp. EFPC2 TaxID=2812648 RepID=UPI0019672F35|nr:YhjD/YihY/BrkB family envelope integrity protein [Methylococcus sp. EFPC2]QSA98150.1 YihY family inner membrane protein [Methylococcus sp. EFPC2]
MAESSKRAYSFPEARIRGVLHSLKKWLHVLMREFDEGGLKHRAMSLVYTTLLSLAPVLAVSFSILKGFGVHNQIQPLLLQALAPLGPKAGELTANIIAFVENIQVGVLGFLGFLMLFYTVVSLLEQVEDCFNHIWRIAKPRSLYRRFSDYLSIVLIGPVLLFSAVGIAASMRNAAIVQDLIALEPFGTAYYLAGNILPYLLVVAAFTFAYSFIPNTPVKLRPALVGGLFAGLTWKATGWLFTRFMADSAQYSAIYSGFAVILLSMIWLYISWLILLFGAVVAFHVQHPRYLGYGSRRPHLSIQTQERLGLLLMVSIGRHHAHGEAACILQVLAEELNLPWEPVAELLECLKRSGLLVTLDGEVKAYVPARDTDQILLRDIVQAIRSAGDSPTLAVDRVEPGMLTDLLGALDESPARTLEDHTLRDVLMAEAPPA